MNARATALALALAACTERPTPGDTDGASSTSSATASSSSSDGPTTGGPSTGDLSTGDPTTGGVPGVHAGPCNPAAGGACPMEHLCCSDDPATVGGKIPNYYMDGVNNAEYGIPIFSDNNNALSTQGYCIDTGEFQSPLVNGCPVPCNPTWDPARISEMCGTAQCCPFTAVDPVKDCIIDPDTGRWRTVNGQDILAKLTTWGPAHTTNQDPLADGCKIFSAGNTEVLLDCIAQLTVADQRGFCFSLGCPCTEDVCDMKNPDWVPRCG